MIKPLAIIPVYNEKLILPHCLEHLQKNGIKNIIVLDNESTDASADIARAYNADVIPFLSNGNHCQETIIKAIQTTINNFQKEFDWILKVDADEFLYAPNGEMLIDFFQRINDMGFNCIGSFGQQTYPMPDEIYFLRKSFDPLTTLKHVIPHITNDKYTQRNHKYSDFANLI